jgi:hypothetical protein
MLNKDKTPRDFKHLDPENLPESDGPRYVGTNAECLADGILDIIQMALGTGMSQQDVDGAMKIVNDTLAEQERHRFRLHVKDTGTATEAE